MVCSVESFFISQLYLLFGVLCYIALELTYVCPQMSKAHPLLDLHSAILQKESLLERTVIYNFSPFHSVKSRFSVLFSWQCQRVRCRYSVERAPRLAT